MLTSCSECGFQKQYCRIAILRRGFWIDYVCPACWERYKYQAFYFKKVEPIEVSDPLPLVPQVTE